jgi:hypothetical protein
MRASRSTPLAVALAAALLVPLARAADWEPAHTPDQKYEESQKLAVDFLKGQVKGDGEKVIDVAITAASLGFPPAGIALGVIKGLFLNLSTSPDPVAEAIKGLDKRLASAEADIRALQGSIQQLRDEQLKADNRARLMELEQRRYDLGTLKNDLLERPQGQAAKSLIDNALRLADRFLPHGEPNENMWYWSDIRVYTDPATKRLTSAMLPKRFEPDLMLETYLQSLALFAAAVDHGGYDGALRPRVQRHVAFLTENPAANADWPMPLPLRMQGRIHCDSTVPSMKYPDKDGVCRETIECDETFPDGGGHYVGQTRRYLTKPVQLANVNLGDWCPQTMLVSATPMIVDFGDRVGDQGVVERIQVMALAAQALDGLGKLKDPKFDHTYYYPQYFYAVTADGELVEYVHEISEDRNPQPPAHELDLKTRAAATEQVTAQAPAPGGVVTRRSKAMLETMVANPAPAPDSVGAVTVREADKVAAVAPQPVFRHKLVGPAEVDTGWSPGAKVYPGGVYGLGAALYVVTPDGVMRWYRHDDYRGSTRKWSAGVQVGTGWNGYARIFGAGDGVVYGIDPAGDLYWYRHLDAANAGPQPKWTPRAKVGNGWGHFLHVFAGGEGLVYAVHPDGRLLWYRHDGYLTGAPSWRGPNEVGTGWGHFRSLFATGSGRIYAVQPNGDLYYYEHTGWADGKPFWRPYQVLGPGFDRFAWLFPAMWGTPKEDVVR